MPLNALSQKDDALVLPGQISPQKYFKRLRLNALYQELKKTNYNYDFREITEAFGFFHQGQLARDYRQLFGEFPSQTFKK